MNDSPTAALAAFTADLNYKQIPADVVGHVRCLVRESIGCMLYGNTLPWTRKVQDLVLGEGGKPEAHILGTTHKAPPAGAVLVNATAGHAFELDDIHRGSIIHAGSLTVPAVLALAEARGGMSGEKFVTAVVAGYEVGCRVGLAAGQSLLVKGFHPQGTNGTYAAAASAARALGLDAARCRHTLGTAGSFAAGLMAAQEGAMVKRLHSGRAAQNGVQAALLAEQGFTGIDDVLEAAYGGYLATHSDDVDSAALTRGLGTDWETLEVGYKPHAAVTSIHNALDALADLMKEHRLTADDIAGITAYVSTPTHVHCAWPYKAQGVTAAQMNIYFGLAVMALEGFAFVEQYQKSRIAEPKILAMIEKIRAEIDPAIDAKGQAARHDARICLETKDGRQLERTETERRGSPAKPLTERELADKYDLQAAAVLSKDQAAELADTVSALETLPDAAVLATLCRPE